MKYAVIQIGGKQLKVSEGDVFCIERQANMDNEVLLIVDDSNINIGTPVVKNASVSLSKVRDFTGDKVVVARFRSKSRYHKKKGHKQPMSEIKVEKISLGASDKAKDEIKKDTKSTKASKDIKQQVKPTRIRKTASKTTKKEVKK